MKHFQIICILTLLFSYNTRAQKIDKKTAERIKIAEAVKNGTTYIIVDDANFPDHEKYSAEIKKRWPFAKDVQFIGVHDGKFDTPISPGDSFIDITSQASYGGGQLRTFRYVRFWALTDNFLKNNNPYARSSLYTIDFTSFDFSYFMNTLSLYLDKTLFFHFDGYPGLMLNIMQGLALKLSPNADKSFSNDQQQLKTLLKDTLYIPEFCFFKGKDYLTHKLNEKEANKVLKDYSLPYKILSCAEIEKKIILSQTPFYYLLHYDGGTAIVNSQTGVNIYWDRSNSYDLEGKDFKKLVKAINN